MTDPERALREETIAEGILRETARMRKNGSLDTASLCWGAADLEALAMYAIDAKNKLDALARAEGEPLCTVATDGVHDSLRGGGRCARCGYEFSAPAPDARPEGEP